MDDANEETQFDGGRPQQKKDDHLLGEEGGKKIQLGQDSCCCGGNMENKFDTN